MRAYPSLAAAGLFFCLNAAAVAASFEAAHNAAGQRARSAALYAELVMHAESGDTNVDFAALRSAYPFTDQYDPYALKTRILVTQSFNAMMANDCTTALAKAEEAFKIDFTIISLHAVRADCLKRSGDPAKADVEDAIARGLYQSLRRNADGKTEQTAFIVASLREEDFLLTALDAAKSGQALIKNQNGSLYDVISASNRKTGEKLSVYFDVGLIFAGQASGAAAGLPATK